MNKQLLTASGQPVVLLGNYDDDSGTYVFLAKDVEYGYTLNAAGEGMYTGVFKLPRRTLTMSVVDFDPKVEAYHSFEDNAVLTRQGSLFLGIGECSHQAGDQLGSVSSYDELLVLLAQH